MSTSELALDARSRETAVAADVDADLALEAAPYRSLSRLALASAVLAFSSLLGLVFPLLLVLAVVAIAAAQLALRQIGRYPREFSGRELALASRVFAAVCFLGGVGLHSTIYALEVPEGYQRISFAELQPEPSRPDLPFSARALELDGQQVFIKGYVYPDGRMGEMQHFVMVPDRGTCCFGGNPPLTHMIEVVLHEPLRIQYSYQQRKLGGVLRVDPRLKPATGVEGVYFRLEADYLR